MHVRQQIRDAIETELAGINLDPSHGVVSVFKNRRKSFQDEHFPAINIRTPDETSSTFVFGQLKRALDVEIQIVLEDKVNATSDPDDYAEEVEKRLSANQGLGGLAVDMLLTRTNLQDDPDNNLIQITLVYSIEYATSFDQPDIALP